MRGLPNLDNIDLDWAAPGVLLATIDRPRSANTVSAQVSRDLLALADLCATDTTVRAVVITGSGDRFFCAGADLRDPEFGPGWIQLARRAYDAFADLAVPTIAAVNGLALGGGTELTLTCDVRFADPSAQFGLPEVKIGSLPGAGGMTRLQSLIGPAAARHLVFTGRQISADRALELGLVDHLSQSGNSVAEAVDYAREIAQYAGYALRAAKTSFANALGTPTAAALTTEYHLFDTMATPEQMALEQQRAADRDPVYARIFQSQAPSAESSTTTKV
ncbi:enoyl-CoA hydratase/isomerase family protein [Rhodococcus sp. T2V]|uniref:enoyl-CoA hydratase/isomerase family protein n=1 Tax=Rhodococcus sp. T2V TaxID=3034164 RepID=UPI0023E30822|nr:enoyl-CoA hydratase/isomerase family protein [Rhodococcus sp. T2V]MDF3312055.1 enoyl-CoA hydratase/isomerase family protein [Rhodococcus sp. T2V]